MVRELRVPEWTALRSGTAIALLNNAAPGPDMRRSAYLSLGSGRRLVLPPGDYTAQDSERYGRGLSSPAAFRVPPLAGRPGVPERTVRCAGGLGEACREAGLPVAYIRPPPSGPLDGPGLLTAMDHEGGISGATTASLAPAGYPTLLISGLVEVAPVVVVEAGGVGPRQLLELYSGLAARLDPKRDLLVLVSPDPGPVDGRQWRYLGPVLLRGPGWTGGSAVSNTTRTPGLLANVDVAPTILEHLGVPVPPTMEGHPARPAPLAPAEVLEFARSTAATHAAMVPGLIAWGALLLLAVALALTVLARSEIADFGAQRAPRIADCEPADPRRDPDARPEGTQAGAFQTQPSPSLDWSPIRDPQSAIRNTARALLAAGSAGPLGMLLIGLSAPATAGELLLRLLVALATVAVAAAFTRRGSPLAVVLLLTAAVALLDLFTGGRGLARNLMSDFANIGARFYGIGNEYTGLLLGLGLIFPGWLAGRPGERRLPLPGVLATAAFWGVLLIGIGAPRLGADFGGAVSTALAFLLAAGGYWSLATGRRVRSGQVLVALALLGALVVGLVALDLSRPPGARSHVGELAARALGDGGRELAEVVAGKLLLNVRTALTPYFLGGLAAVTPLLWLWYHRLGRAAWAVLEARPLLKVAVLSTFTGGAISLFLNDTGVVSWALATGVGLVVWLDVWCSGIQVIGYSGIQADGSPNT